MKCALIEFNDYHEEVLPTFVLLLNRLGIEPDVYMVPRSARRRPFALLDDLRFRRRRIEDIDRAMGIPYRLRGYDLEIIGSTEPEENLELAARSGRPLLGVIHNTRLLIDDPAYQAFFAAPRRMPFLMGRHIAEHVEPSLGPLPWMSHVVFGRPDIDRTPGELTTFVVSGNVEYRRRNYMSLLDAASELAGAGTPFRVRIAGRSTVRDGMAFRAEVQERGLEDLFEYSPGETDHPAFFRLVADADFSLPLIDTTDELYRAYLETKLASSVPFAIGLGVPIVGHGALVGVYGLAGAAIPYEDGGLAGAMRRAIASTPQERAALREGLASRQREIIEASLANLRGAIEAVSGPPGS